MEHSQEISDYVAILINEGASDLHLAEGRHPIIRVAGSLIPLVKKEELSGDRMEKFLKEFLRPDQYEKFKAKKEIDFAYSYSTQIRFRGNAYYFRDRIGIALRLIPEKIKTLEELGLPPILESFTTRQSGFFLVVGPTGQGKSTTLAAMIEMINQSRLEHIITIEDPIEYVYKPKKSVIDQREVGEDTPDFKTALRGVFRQDVDVLLIGEMREPETISTAVTAAETGHLVFSTLHTNSAAQTVDRIIDSFPPDQQGQIRLQLAGSLAGIFSQRLIPSVTGGVVPAYELLISNNAVANLIREGRTHEINTVIETGVSEGMIELNRSLVELVRQGQISVENAFAYSSNPKILEKLL